jgi:sugar O-acyltransferase (sialic acid O-acetyltransferase NeuD family)
MRRVVIVGAGGHGRVCAEIATAAGFTVAGFCDAARGRGETVNGLTVLANELAQLGPIAPPDTTEVFIAIGDNARRAALFEAAVALGYRLATLIHPTAVVSATARIAAGSVLMPAVVVNANTRIGRNCIVNTSASLDHDNDLADGVQICPGVRSAGTVRFGAEAFIGTGAVIVPGRTIGARARVSAGAVVFHDVAEGVTVAGNPARPRGPS